MKRLLLLIILSATIVVPSVSHAMLESFAIKPITSSGFRTFVKVFSEMRGPLRVRMLKDRKSNFKDADPLKYVMMVKDEKDVKKMLQKSKINWDQFTELMGNILLGYFSIQPDKTKAGLIKQLSEYGLGVSDSQIPAEYRQAVADILKTDEGASLASMALEFIIKIPPENIALAKKNKRTLDQLFYTRFWKK
jgi:hypothetical protein